MAPETLTMSGILSCLKEAGLLIDHKGTLPNGALPAYTTDTRKLSDGELFIAYKGVQFDAHARVPELARQFPNTVFVIEEPRCFDVLEAGTCALLVKDSRDAWSHIAALSYGNPEKNLRLVGVTGTNGKTSTVWFLRQILLSKNIPCLTLGTLGVYCGDEMLPATHTTPDPEDLFKNLAIAAARGIRWVAMEVSSHAIVQRRLGPVRFDAVAFTSFSRDHLDFHPTMKDYFAAKWQLFERYRKAGAPAWVSTTVREQKILPKKDRDYGFYGPSESLATDARSYSYAISESRLNHTHLSLKTPTQTLELDFGFGGDFVMDNFAAAFALVDSLEPIETIQSEAVHPVPGRFEPVAAAHAFQFAVIVDYAHTPDALEKTLTKLKAMTSGQLWVIFGCGGDRDNGKRPLMGEIAERIADQVIVSSDNPRTEIPSEIIKQIVKGMIRKKAIHIIEDRQEAIAFACLHARPGDSVLIAGKGHEDYQIIGKTKFPFDDRLVAAESLHKRTQ